MSPLISRTLTAVTLLLVAHAAWAQATNADPRVRLRQGVKREELDAENTKTYDLIVNATSAHRDNLPAPIGMWMWSPRLGDRILPIYNYLRFGTQLDVRTKELAILIAARYDDSRVQWGTHGVNARRIGVEQRVIDVIGSGAPLDGLAAKDAATIALGREMLGDKRVSSQTFASALKLFGRRGVTDLAGLIAFYEFLYLSSNATFDLEGNTNYPALPPLPRTAGVTRAASSSSMPADIDRESRARLPRVRREELDADGKKTYDAIVNAKTPYANGLPSPIGMWMHSPEMAQYVLPAYMYVRFGNQFGTRLTEVAILTTARETDCQYQWTSHEPVALNAGVARNVIDVIKFKRNVDGLAEKDAFVVRFGRELFRNRHISAETFSLGMKLFGTAGVTDLAGLMAFYEFLYLSSNATFDIQMAPGQQPLLPTS